jgi:hypothetical protein
MSAAMTAHRADDAMVSHQSLELLARILAAAIGVMQQGVRPAALKNSFPVKNWK